MFAQSAIHLIWTAARNDFVFFAYLSMLLIHQAYESDTSQKRQLLYAALVGLSIYLSYGTRSLGIILLPCLFIYGIIRTKKPYRFVFIAISVSVLFMVLQTVFLHSDRSYYELFTINPKLIFYNLFWYAKSLRVLWDNGYSELLGMVLFIVVFVLAIICDFAITLRHWARGEGQG